MFPIMMDEPDAMAVAPSVWHTLESVWRSECQRQAEARRGQHGSTAQSPLGAGAVAGMAWRSTVHRCSGARH